MTIQYQTGTGTGGAYYADAAEREQQWLESAALHYGESVEHIVARLATGALVAFPTGYDTTSIKLRDSVAADAADKTRAAEYAARIAKSRAADGYIND